MSMKYVRDTYGVPVAQHMLVRPLNGRFAGDELIVTRCSNYVHARHLFGKQVYRFHPHDLEYKTADGWKRAESKKE